MERTTDNFEKYLKGNDLRSLGESGKIIPLINDQKCFDTLFSYLDNNDRNVKMKTIDAIEKATSNNTEYLQKHKNKIIELCKEKNENIEFKWHLAQLTARLDLTKKETDEISKILKEWILNKKESKIVRVNALESFYNLVKNNKKLEKEFGGIIKEIVEENIPSIKARIKKILMKNRNT
jgi:hypothetical protein